MKGSEPAELPHLAPLRKEAEARRALARRSLYEAFAGYRPSAYGSPGGPCSHCVTEESYDALCLTPLAELSVDQVWSYCGAEWSGVPDFKYFLPRVLEIAELASPSIDWHELGRKLPEAGWSVCSQVELNAVALHVNAVDEHEKVRRASEASDPALLLLPLLMETRLTAGLPLAGCSWPALAAARSALFESRLELWQAHSSLEALAMLARAGSALLEDPRARKLLKAARRTLTPTPDPFVAWLTSGAAAAAVHQAFQTTNIPEELAVQLGTALGHLERGDA